MGIPSVVEACVLPSLIGWGRARQMMILGENISADEALNWNLIEKVVEPNQLDNAVEQWLQQLEKNGPRGMQLQKALIRNWEEKPDLASRIEAGVRSFGAAFEKTDPNADAEPNVLMKHFLEERAAAKKQKAQQGGSKL